MNVSGQYLNASEAARRLGVSTKALRLYEVRGLISPARTAAGWRAYGPNEMARAGEIVALRALRLSHAQVAQVLSGDPQCLEPALAAHQAELENQTRLLGDTIAKVQRLRNDLTGGQAPDPKDLAQMVQSANTGSTTNIAFNLEWPWGGERFELRDIKPLAFITGPLGSGKTRLAKAIADALPGGSFIDLDRLADDGAAAVAQLEQDGALKSRVNQAMTWLIEDGAQASPALTALLVALEAELFHGLVIDLVEQGLDQASQEALIGWLRQRAPDTGPLFLLTRSLSILDMSEVGPTEAIILCPANHSPPMLVAPYPGTPGYEAVATCLALPEVRARTEGVIALRPQRA